MLAQRWEEGWQQPLESWREALGIRNLISQSPFPPLAGETKEKTEASLVGSWQLRSLKIQLPGSPDATPIWGEQPLGQLTYTADGFMSAVLCQRERNHSVAAAGAADDGEQARLFRESYGYAGRYSLTTDGVIHHIEVAANPNWISTDQHHVTQINGSELTISTTAIANVVDQTPVSLVSVWQKLQTDSY